MSLLDMLGSKPKTAKANNNGIIEIGITEKDITALLKGEVSELVITRGLTTHTITKTGKQNAKGLDMFSVSIAVACPFSMIVAPAIIGKKARIYVVDDKQVFNDDKLKGFIKDIESNAKASALHSEDFNEFMPTFLKQLKDSLMMLEGTALVLTEENASKLYSDGVCEQSKEGVAWCVMVDESRQRAWFDGGALTPFKYRCAALEKLGVNIDELIERA